MTTNIPDPMIDMMTRILFEEPLHLALYVFVAMVVLLGLWICVRSRATSRALLAGLVIAPLIFVMQWLVETDREKLESTTRQLARWVEAGDVANIIGLFDSDCRFDDGQDLENFQAHLTRLLEKYTIQNPTFAEFDIEVTNRRAVLQCRSSCVVSTHEWRYPMPSQWELQFEWDGDRWLITGLRPLEIAGQAFRSFWQIH